MRGSLVAVWLLVGCGRVDFDTQAVSQPGDAATDVNGDADMLQAIPPGAKIWLRMDSGPATGIVDSAGGHSASCVGSCPMRVPALHGDGYLFDQQEVDVASSADLDSSAGFTGAVWINLTDTPASLACVWSRPFDAAQGFDTFTLCIDTDRAVVFDCETPAGVADAETGPVIAIGTWHHLAMTWDGATKRGYLDGAQIVAKGLLIGSGTEAVTLGGEASAFFTPALVDDALYYTRALTAAEVMQLATP